MDSARNAVSSLLGRDGTQTTDVDENVAPAVTEENIRPHRHEETTEAVDREIHQDHYHTTVQPIAQKETLPEQHQHNIAPQLERSFEHGDVEQDRARVAQDLGQFRDTSSIQQTTQSASAGATAIGEHTHHHVHEIVQPVIHKETIQPEVVHTTIPIHEKHTAPSEHHGLSVLPTKSLSEMQGVVGGGQASHTEYEGHPKPYNHSMQPNPEDVDLHPERHEGEHDPEATGHFSHGHSSGIGGTTGSTGGIMGTSGTSGTTDTSGLGGYSGTDRGIGGGVGGAALGAGAGGLASGLGHHGDSSRGTSGMDQYSTGHGLGDQSSTGGYGTGQSTYGSGPGEQGLTGGYGTGQSTYGSGLGEQGLTGGYGTGQSTYGSGIGDQSSTGGYGTGQSPFTGVGDQTSTGGSGNSAAMGSGIGGVAAGSAAEDLGRDHTRAHQSTGIDARDSSGGILGDSGSSTAGTALGGRTEGNIGERGLSAAEGHHGGRTSDTHGNMAERATEAAAGGAVGEEVGRHHGHDTPRSEHREGNAHRGPNDNREPTNLTGGDAEPKKDISADDDVQHASKIGEDPSIAKRGDGKLTGTGQDGSHSAVFGLTPDGHKYNDTKSSTTKMPQREEDLKEEETGGQDSGSRGAGSAGVAEQMHDPRVAEKGHEGRANYGADDGDMGTKPGGGLGL